MCHFTSLHLLFFLWTGVEGGQMVNGVVSQLVLVAVDGEGIFFLASHQSKLLLDQSMPMPNNYGVVYLLFASL